MRVVAMQPVRHARRRTKLGGGAGIDTQRSQIDERERVPVCVWKGCIKGEHIVATVHGDDITIGGERSAVELFTNMMSRKYEIKVKMRTSLGHAREIVKDHELEQANHAATPCNMDKKKENNARSDGSKGENQCEQGQRRTKHDWDDAGDGDDKNRVQMTNDERDDAKNSQALTGGDVTKCRALVAHISYLSQDRQDLNLRQCKYAVRWQNHQFVTWNVSRGSEETSLASRQQSAGSAGSRVVSWKRIQTPIGEATKPLDDRCQPELSREADTALRYGPRSSSWCHCSPPRASCTPLSEPRQKGQGSRVWQRTWEYRVG